MFNDFPIVKKGYDPHTVEAHISLLQKKIESYQQKDNVINNAIVSAQIAADNIIHEAHIKSEKILADTESKLKQMKNLLANQENIIKNFENDYNELVKKYLPNLDGSDVLKISSKINNIGEKINALKFSDSFTNDNNSTSYSDINFNNQLDDNFSNLNLNPTDNNFSNLNFNNSDNNSANFSNLNFNNPTDNNSAN